MAQGLTSQQAVEALKRYGPNTIQAHQASIIGKMLRWLVSPISLMLMAAAGLSWVSDRVFDFYFILALMLLNLLVGSWQEYRADRAIEKLRAGLTVRVRVVRDGKAQDIDSLKLVPGDTVMLSAGDVIAADVEIKTAKSCSINEAAVTGESLPKDKKPGDKAFAGSFLVAGQAEAVVTATGMRTSFGATIAAATETRKRSLLEEDIFRIARFLAIVSVVAIVVLTVVLWSQHVRLVEIITLDLSLAIAGIPISLPTVMTLIISFGVLRLAAKHAIVRRLSSLENLANANVLLTDKTGTLTENRISVQEVVPYDSFTPYDLLLYALMGDTDQTHPINHAIAQKADAEHVVLPPLEVVDFVPVDSERKRSTKIIRRDGRSMVVSIGAPQVVSTLLAADAMTHTRLTADIGRAAQQGYRVVAVAVHDDSDQERDMHLVGLLFLSDTLRSDAAKVIDFLQSSGVQVQMVTGDNRAIADHMAHALNIDTTHVHAEVTPRDKYELVQQFKKDHVVAATGDGVNDFAALEAADVGIAVKSAVDALRSSADIVLLTDGISVIENAFLEARRIFARLYTYSLYRLSESFRLIIAIAVLGLWYKLFPLTPIQIILLALLNDAPIISLATDRVRIAHRPATINAPARLRQSMLYGSVGLINSLLVFFILTRLGVSFELIQTVFFLKLMVSGHLLVFVAHTSERWWRFLPSRAVIIATVSTQLVATAMAIFGIFMPAIPIGWVVLVWAWAFFWMQATELVKHSAPTPTVDSLRARV